MIILKRFGFACILVCTSCSHYALVDYRDVEKTNSVSVKTIAGGRVAGTVQTAEPHQIVLLGRNQEAVTIQKSAIREIRRKTPVKDDFGNGISEEEIARLRTRKNTWIYGMGGGALSLGISFFAGSMIGNSSDQAGPFFGAATVGGSILGTVMFVHAGKNRDRQNAIRQIKEMRRSAEVEPRPDKKAPDDMKRLLEEERKKQEELRKERETLLKQLQETPTNL